MLRPARPSRSPWAPILLTLLSVGTLASVARAAEPTPERPLLPGLSSAGEDGAATMWTNPAALGLDPDPSAWLSWSQALELSPGTLAGALQGGPLALGLTYRPGADAPGWLSLSNGLGLRLGRRVAMGLNLGWQIPEGAQNNFVTWDVGMAWRPAHWLGVSLIAQNLNNPAPDLGVRSRFGGGVAWRPLDGRLLLGVDYTQQDLTADASGLFSATARVELIDGLVLRAHGDQQGELGGGLELFWGRAGAGLYGRAMGDGSDTPVGLAYLTTAEGDHSVFDSGHRVPEIVLDTAFPDQPQATLFVKAGESWLHLVQRIQEAIEDPRVRGLALHIDRPPGSWARVQELRDLLHRARSRGKLTVAYLDRDAGNAAYALAAAADRIYLHPAATLDLKGLSLELQYFRDTLDLVGVEPQFVRRAEYKSSPEQWTRDGPTEPALIQLEALLDGFTDDLIAAVAAGRGKPADHVERLLDRGPFTATEAEVEGLVDGLLYPDQLERELEQTWRRRLHLDPDYGLDDQSTGWPAAREIAVIYVDGVITTGRSGPSGLFGPTVAGSDTIVRQLDQARRDDAVQAVVLRVDSPGGSAFASDEIWRATQRLVEADKPLIVSMGGVAASGGYYVSAGADTIFAEPGTITGSIGVYSGKFSLAGLYDKLGVRTEILSRGRHAAMDSSARPWDESELEAMERLVQATYVQFKERVADGRGLTEEQVEEVARGRVWSGREALEVGLVDELGGLDAAIEAARRQAGIARGATIELISYGDRDDGSLPRRTVRAAARAVGQLALGPGAGAPLPPVLQNLGTWARLADDPTWAMMPWQVEIH